MEYRLTIRTARSRATRLIVVLMLAAVALAADRPGPLARARLAYNQERYDDALAAAAEALAVPATAARARLLTARALLERFRSTGDAADLAKATDMLAAIEPSKLGAGERSEMQVGLAEALFFDDRFGAAADLFEDALSRPGQPGYWPRERLIGWLATSLDRQATVEAAPGRRRIYRRLLERMTAENRTGSGSAAASYWVVAAMTSLGDVDGAWDAAIATWIRAPLAAGDLAALRSGLDRLVVDTIIPQRGRLGASGSRAQTAIEAMRADWEKLKQAWPGR